MRILSCPAARTSRVNTVGPAAVAAAAAATSLPPRIMNWRRVCMLPLLLEVGQPHGGARSCPTAGPDGGLRNTGLEHITVTRGRLALACLGGDFAGPDDYSARVDARRPRARISGVCRHGHVRSPARCYGAPIRP